MWQRLLIPLIFALAFLTLSCATPDIDEGEVNRLRPNINQNTNVNVNPNANVAEDNETELNSLIELPFEAVENVFKEIVGEDPANEDDPNFGKRSVIAVLKFSDEDTKALVEKLKEKAQPFEATVDPETWFPAELIAKSQMSGDESIKGNGYSAEMFFKEPFIVGSLTRVTDTDYFVLKVQTK